MFVEFVRGFGISHEWCEAGSGAGWLWWCLVLWLAQQQIPQDVSAYALSFHLIGAFGFTLEWCEVGSGGAYSCGWHSSRCAADGVLGFYFSFFPLFFFFCSTGRLCRI